MSETLDRPVTALEGVGPARAAALEKLGVATVRDLVLLIPRRLEVWSGRVPIAEALEEIGALATIGGTVEKRAFHWLPRRRSLLRLKVADDSGEVDVLFFNQPWMRERFEVGETLSVHGQVVDSKGPALVAKRLGTDARPLPDEGAIDAVYPGVDGLGPERVGALCRLAVELAGDELEEALTGDELRELGLPPLTDAVRELHGPTGVDAFRAAARRVALDSVLVLQARLAERRRSRDSSLALACEIDEARHAELCGRLPFELTRGQEGVTRDLRADLERRVPMRRLLQGDVGSGKTVLGLYACMAVAADGGQAAFLAPTELLAEQHFDGLRALCERAGLRAELLTGSLRTRERRRVLDALETGLADVVFGTHALYSDAVRFDRLALAVVDEQHRFGVSQRQKLFEKGRDVHALLMTATPIPRTLALTLYGDLDVSLLKDRPPGRGEVTTRWVREDERRAATDLVVERLEAGEQVYWVVPRIEGEDDAKPGAERRYEALAASHLARYGIELVHGRLPSWDRAERLERFRRGEARLLVATTVIEVGVDVPEATVLVVEDAERLGLAQLHQLRGRVGRGPKPSWCLLVGTEGAAERFELLERTRDGFELAEEDLRRRGMGDLVGVRQAGDNAEGLGDPERDLDLLLFARDRLAARPALAEAYLRRAPKAADV